MSRPMRKTLCLAHPYVYALLFSLFPSADPSNRPSPGTPLLVEIDAVERALTELAAWRKECTELEERCARSREQCAQFSVALPAAGPASFDAGAYSSCMEGLKWPP